VVGRGGGPCGSRRRLRVWLGGHQRGSDVREAGTWRKPGTFASKRRVGVARVFKIIPLKKEGQITPGIGWAAHLLEEEITH